MRDRVSQRQTVFCSAAFVALIAFVSPFARAHGAIDALIVDARGRVAATPSDARAHFRLAELLLQHEEAKASLEELDRTEALGASGLPVDFVRSEVLLALGRPADALAAAERFCRTAPESPGAQAMRARALQALGRGDEALAAFREALRRSPHPEPDLIYEASALAENIGRLDEAANLLEDTIARLGPVPTLCLRAVELDCRVGRWDAALVHIDTLASQAPRPEPWLARRARVLAQAGRSQAARAAWEELLSRIRALPSLDRGARPIALLQAEAEKALAAPPASSVSQSVAPADSRS